MIILNQEVMMSMEKLPIKRKNKSQKDWNKKWGWWLDIVYGNEEKKKQRELEAKAMYLIARNYGEKRKLR